MTCKPWPIVWTEPAGASVEQIAAAKAAAQTLLWALSGRQYGRCVTTQLVAAWDPVGGRTCTGPELYDGEWYNDRNGGVGWCCAIRLFHVPIRQVTEVKIGGVVVPPADYFVDAARRRLVRRSGCWPRAAVCEEFPIEVTYAHGRALPAGAAQAMGEVAGEFVKGFTTGKCALPSRMVNLARQGVTMQFESAIDYEKRGRLGLPLADAFLRVTNPSGLPDVPSIVSPDTGLVR